jgi:hypothetical protein
MSKDSPFREAHRFQIIDRNPLFAGIWEGGLVTLLPTQNVNMAQTPNGSMILTYQNVSHQNSQGTISLTSGGSAPEFLQAYALSRQPSLKVNNWKANNLSVTNISPTGANIPIQVQARGPGMPGLLPVNLPYDGTVVPLTPGFAAQGQTLPQYMNLTMTNHTSQLAVLALIGGPPDASGNNAYVFAVNSPQGNTGPGTGKKPPDGYYATTAGNQATFQFNWGAAILFIVNLSASNATATDVSLYWL